MGITKLWKDICNIYEYKKVKENRITDFKEVLVHENIPCRISFKNIVATNQTESYGATAQEIKLFLSNQIEIKENSTIEVIRNGTTRKYKCSGTPAIYSLHQEVILILNKEKA